ncbi:adenine phosphoribosyltransferase [Lactiplantibacillus plantarum]|nr:adenine phosphoribosyltransferase [Lactiplantibacillus plantarum]MCG0693226.1 adenine phosphoribosyltransferase [Lactiplantibacillus plantarum]
MQTYQLTLGSLTRQLPLIRLNATTSIASFVLLGDAELTDYAARQLSQRLTTTKFDYLVTMESKGIPLAQALSQATNHPRFIVLRKNRKDYMQHPLIEPVSAITTSTPQQLVLDGTDAALINHKRVIIIDDVISSGGSLTPPTPSWRPSGQADGNFSRRRRQRTNRYRFFGTVTVI